jgi:hypothetical protein
MIGAVLISTSFQNAAVPLPARIIYNRLKNSIYNSLNSSIYNSLNSSIYNRLNSISLACLLNILTIYTRSLYSLFILTLHTCSSYLLFILTLYTRSLYSLFILALFQSIQRAAPPPPLSRFCYDRLSSLMKTLEVSNTEEFTPIQV